MDDEDLINGLEIVSNLLPKKRFEKFGNLDTDIFRELLFSHPLKDALDPFQKDSLLKYNASSKKRLC